MEVSKFQEKMIDKRRNLIQEQIYARLRFHGEEFNARNISHCDIIVKVCRNEFESGFYNGDICQGFYELDDGRLFIRRLFDNHEGIVNKEILKTPVWFDYLYE